MVSAFTATATREVRDDIMDILLLENPEVLTTGFDRPNLYFGVQSPKDKYGAVSYTPLHIGKITTMASVNLIYQGYRRLFDVWKML